MVFGSLDPHAPALHDCWCVRRRIRRIHEHLLPRQARYGGEKVGGGGRRRAAKAVKNIAVLAALGVGLVAVATLVGGRPAAIGGSVAVIAQLWAVAALGPKMRGPNPEFMARWL